MYVCVCRGITDRDIRNAIAEGANSVADVAQMLGAGSDCGSCQDFTREMIRDAHRMARLEDLAYAAA